MEESIVSEEFYNTVGHIYKRTRVTVRSVPVGRPRPKGQEAGPSRPLSMGDVELGGPRERVGGGMGPRSKSTEYLRAAMKGRAVEAFRSGSVSKLAEPPSTGETGLASVGQRVSGCLQPLRRIADRIRGKSPVRKDGSDCIKSDSVGPEGTKANGRIRASVDIGELGGIRAPHPAVTEADNDDDDDHHHRNHHDHDRHNGLKDTPQGLEPENNNVRLSDSMERLKGVGDVVESDEESVYERLEIVGDSNTLRFPWQRDMTTQCGSDATRDAGVQTEYSEVCEKCNMERAPRSEHNSLLHRVFRGSPSNHRKKGKLHKQQSLDCMLPPKDFVDGTVTPPRPRSKSALPPGRPFTEHDPLAAGMGHSMLSVPNIANGASNQRLSVAGLQLSASSPEPDVYNDKSSYPSSPIPSPHPSPELPLRNPVRRASSRSRPKLVFSHHPEDSDSNSLLGGGSLNDSAESLTSESSSLRVPSPEFLQTKARYPGDTMVGSTGSDAEDDTVIRPSFSRINQRRGAVISQVAPAAEAPPPEEDAPCTDQTDSPPRNSGTATTLGLNPAANQQMDLLLPPGVLAGSTGGPSTEHRASIMSEASTTLASVAAQHIQGFIESSAQGLEGPGMAGGDGQDNKKTISAILKKKFGKQDKTGMEDMTVLISNFKIHDQDDLEFAVFKDKHWRDFMDSSKEYTMAKDETMTKDESKRRDKVWELFRSECVFLVDHILVLKEIFQERLKWLQCEDHLMHIEIVKLFANVDELCTVSANFCRELVKNISSRLTSTEFGHTDAIVAAFSNFGSQVCPAYSRYCMNYSGALQYLDTLKKQEDFVEFLRLCEQDRRCKRLQLTDFLITPIQRITKYTLLLRDIRDCTVDTGEREALSGTLQSVESALGDLEGKVKWLANFERLREIHQMISWPPMEELDSKLAVPEFLRSTINRKSKDNLLMSTKRSLIHEGYLQIFENGRLADVYVFLFDDMLLITRKRRQSAKKRSIPDSPVSHGQHQISLPRLKDNERFVVHKPPIPLDRLEQIDYDTKQAAASGIKHGFVLMQISRYGQVVGVYTFACSHEGVQQTWLGYLHDSRSKWVQILRDDHASPKNKEEKKRDERKKTL